MKKIIVATFCLLFVLSCILLSYAENETAVKESEEVETQKVEVGLELDESEEAVSKTAKLTYDEIKDIVFNTMVDDERVFKFPKDNDNFYTKNMQFPCRGAMLLTVPGVSDGKLQIASMMFVFNNEKDPDNNFNFTALTFWEVEDDQQENVLDLIGESLNKYIDYENGGKLVFCMTQDLEKESQILFEYSPVISQYSDKDVYKTQNYSEFDSYDAFKDKVYNVIYPAYHGVEPNTGSKDEEVASTVEILQKGSRGDKVVKLQKRLNELGYSVGTADGDFGSKTKTAVENFQRDHGLDVTGIVDENTHDAIFSDGSSDENEGEAAGSFSELSTFQGKMMDSVASQITSATDLTTTSNNRAILAALLSLEFVTQQPDFAIDYSLPIYVCKQGSIAAVAVGGEKDYAIIIFQMNPLSTSYGYLYGNDPATVKAALEATNEHVWQVPLDEYNEKLAGVVDQL